MPLGLALAPHSKRDDDISLMCATWQGLNIHYGSSDEEGLQGAHSKSRRSLAFVPIGDAVRVDDQIDLGDGDTAGAMFSEETGLALKPLQRPKKPPYVANRSKRADCVCISLNVLVDVVGIPNRRCCRTRCGRGLYSLVNRSQPLRAVREYFGALPLLYAVSQSEPRLLTDLNACRVRGRHRSHHRVLLPLPGVLHAGAAHTVLARCARLCVGAVARRSQALQPRH